MRADGECKEAGFMRCDEKCIHEKRRCDGVVDCTDMTDESYCCDGGELPSVTFVLVHFYRFSHTFHATPLLPFLDRLSLCLFLPENYTTLHNVAFLFTEYMSEVNRFTINGPRQNGYCVRQKIML